MKRIFMAGSFILSAAIIQAQNVGIGTPTPAAKLNIVGVGSDPAIPGTTSTGVFRIGISPNEGIDFGKTGFPTYAAWMQVGLNGIITDAISLQPLGGNVGIGTLSPTAKLDLNGTMKIQGINTLEFGAGVAGKETNAGKIGYQTFTAGALDIVGAGTTFATRKVNIFAEGGTTFNGQVKITGGAPAAGKILTSDATGLASWQTNNTAAAGNLGFGVWGDCATNGNISEYYPVADATGAAGDAFGTSVSISGNYAIVGAPNDDGISGANQGSASIYQFSTGVWVLMNKITDPIGASVDFFGRSVSISGNYAIVGASQDDVGANVDQGSASIYTFNGSNWVFMQTITDPIGAPGDFFGGSVSISGNYAIVGSEFDNVGTQADQGSAIIYRFNGSSWVFLQKISDPLGAAGDRFGGSVSISGNYAIVGAKFDDIGASSNEGSASFYQYNGSNWVLMQTITDPGGVPNENFGVSVSISGNYAVVGANLDDVGANLDQGSVSFFHLIAGAWVFTNKIREVNGAASNEFGRNVSISGNYALAGSFSNQGSVSIYIRVGLAWQKLQYVTDPGSNGSDGFGIGTAINGITQQFLIGADRFANNMGKVVFGKIN